MVKNWEISQRISESKLARKKCWNDWSLVSHLFLIRLLKTWKNVERPWLFKKHFIFMNKERIRLYRRPWTIIVDRNFHSFSILSFRLLHTLTGSFLSVNLSNTDSFESISVSLLSLLPISVAIFCHPQCSHCAAENVAGRFWWVFTRSNKRILSSG